MKTTDSVNSIYNPAIKYRPEIDGLRAVAVLPVILFHAGLDLFSGGFVGVDVFFVISGFLITSIILRELSQGNFSIVKFYERRARRILPALFFVIACTLPFAYLWLLPDEFGRYGKSLVAVATFVSNIYFWRSTDYFSPDAENELLLHTWSLAVEEQYYVLFPIFLMVLWKFYRSRLFWSVAAAALLSFLVCEWGWRVHPVPNFYFLLTRAWELLIGSLVAIWLASARKPIAIPNSIREILVGAGLLAIVLSSLLFDESIPFPSYYAAIPTLGAALIIGLGTGKELTSRLLSLRPIVFIGLISYSAYLWHQPIFALLRLRGFGEISEIIFFAAALGSLLLATFTWHYVERPFRSRSTNSDGEPALTRAVIFSLSAAGICAIALFGIGMIALGLNGERSNPVARDGIPKECQHLARLGDSRCSLATERDAENRVIVLWGDSYADAFSMSLITRAQAESVDVYPLIFHSCPSLTGTSRNEGYRLGPRFSRECSDYTEKAKSFIAELKPDVVVLANSYARYSSEINPHNLKPILLSQAFEEKNGLDVVLDSLAETVEFLNEMSIGVVLVTPHPKSENFRVARRKSKLFGWDSVSHALNPNPSQDLTAQMLSVLNSRNLKLETVSPTSHLCEQIAPTVSDCSSFDSEGNYLLHDGSHISLFLAALFADDVFSASLRSIE